VPARHVAFEEPPHPKADFPFFLRQFHVGPHRNFAYVIGDRATRTAMVVDAAFELPRLRAAIARSGYRLTHATATHAHDDHAGGLRDLAASGLKVVLHGSWREVPRAAALEGSVQYVPEEPPFLLGELPVRFLPTPGHTPESACLLVGTEGRPQALLGGDTLFVNACGRCDLSVVPPAEAELQMFRSLERLRALPGDVTLFPGHHYAGFASRGMAQQRRENPALAVRDFDVWKGFWFLRKYA
jgi:hydroxyacylglutathione hydrolase